MTTSIMRDLCNIYITIIENWKPICFNFPQLKYESGLNILTRTFFVFTLIVKGPSPEGTDTIVRQKFFMFLF